MSRTDFRLVVAVVVFALASSWMDFLAEPPRDEKRVQWVAAADSEVHGNTDSKIFHGSDCRWYNCKACVRRFENREAAIEAGYRPCKVCKP